MLCHMMQNELLSIDAELEKDWFKGLQIRELNDTEKFPSHVLRQETKSYQCKLHLNYMFLIMLHAIHNNDVIISVVSDASPTLC